MMSSDQSLAAMTPAWRHGPPGREGLSHCRPQTLLSPATRGRSSLKDKKTNASMALKEFRRAVVRDKESNPFGVRFTGSKIPWKIVTPSAEKGKPPEVERKEHRCSKVQEEYDLFIMDLYMKGVHALHTSFECELSSTESETDQTKSRKEALETEFLAIEQTANRSRQAQETQLRRRRRQGYI